MPFKVINYYTKYYFIVLGLADASSGSSESGRARVLDLASISNLPSVVLLPARASTVLALLASCLGMKVGTGNPVPTASVYRVNRSNTV